MKRRGWNNSALPTPPRPHSARRKPEWNTYLTDDRQYKLNQQQQLQRALQQLSTAHFAARSPAASTSRRRVKAASAHRSAWSTPRNKERLREQSTRFKDVKDTGELNTQRRLEFDVSLDLEETTPRRRPERATSVSFQDDTMNPEQKMTMQTELEVLEKMLWQLETETEQCSRQPIEKAKKSPGETVTVEVETPTQERDEKSDQDEEHDEVETDARLKVVCYKSLEFGLELTRQVDSLKSEVENERRRRADQELQMNMLTQEMWSTQAKCKYLEAKCHSMATEIDNMRDAVITTQQAIHRMTLAFEYSQRQRTKTSNPTTPSKSVGSRSEDKKNNVQGCVKKTTTPRRRSKAVEQQENWISNRQEN